VDKPRLDKFRGNGRSRREVDWLFFAQDDYVIPRAGQDETFEI
jgi:hypothetical protein